MSITRNRLAFERNFVQVPNEWMRDKRLSRRARGLLAEIMTHSVGWEITVESLVDNGPEGRDAIRGAILELESAGYLVRQITRSSGKYAGVDYMIQEPNPPAPENPTLVNDSESNAPAPEKPTSMNPQQRTPSFQEECLLPTVVNGSAEENPQPDPPEQVIAKTLYDETKGALPFMGMRSIAKWAIDSWPDVPWQQVGSAMRNLHLKNRAVTKANLRLVLDGIMVPGRSQYGRPSGADVLNQARPLVEQLLREEQEQEARLQLEA